ncbi:MULTISPECIES: RBBP9/YdeN family alpha/beta hydrolase [Kordiimonas]|uniref:RBBP9/YdeN family alpha/beta hydrolase n=1 Tax=Kordiimonas TaxID=288021 RepID=UPI00257DC953|nr:alpha/beta fold hydrolase [Kordiimonas sp. UBA4487]
MTARVILSPCWTGTREWGWYPWLSRELTQNGVPFGFADMPNPDLPDVDTWSSALLDRIDHTAIQETILVGHSLGCINILNAIAQLPPNKPHFKAVVFIAPFTHPLGVTAVDTFFTLSVAANLSKLPARYTWVIASDNDPYIPDTWANLERLNKGSKANTLVLHGRAHFSAASGCTELPELSTLIQSILECDDEYI